MEFLKVFNFLCKIPGFSKNNRALSKFLYEILITKLALPNFLKNQSIKPNFTLTTQAIFRHFRFYTVEQFQSYLLRVGSNDFYSTDQKKIYCFSNYLLPTQKKSCAYLTNSQCSTWLLKIYRLW